ncbi:MAG: hypothetical protein Q9167_001175, partial [Letrouitia subvulpina]
MSSTTQERWYQKSEGAQKDRNSLRWAALAVEEDPQFKCEAGKILSSPPQKSLEGLERQVEQLLKDEARNALEGAGSAEDQWEKKGQRGPRKFGRGIQAFATSFIDFTRAYAGFVDVVRQASGPYGEVAYSTLSIFFMAFVNESENDDKFAGTLEELRKEFPRITLAQDIYPQASVEERVSEVYREVILFARESTKYFLAKPWYRVVKGLMKPPSTLIGVDKAIQRVHSCLVELNAEIGILLHQNVQRILSKNNKLLNQNKEVEANVAYLRRENQELMKKLDKMEKSAMQEAAQRDNENLEQFCRTLGDISEKHTDPQFCRRTLEDAFPEAFDLTESYAGWSRGYSQITPELLQSNDHYRSWRERPASCLLIYGGITMGGGQSYQSTCSWLSPAALHAVNKLSLEGKRLVFYSCHPDINPNEHPSKLIISNLSYRLIAWKPAILRHRVKEFESVVGSSQWNAQANESLQCQFDFLKRVIASLEMQEDIFIILDRVDLCRGPKYRFIEAVQSLINCSPSPLKVLIVMNRIADNGDRGECHELLSSKA